MKISHIPTPENTYLVEIVTDKNDRTSHMIYFLNKDGNLVEDGVLITDAELYQVISLIKHMMVVHFNSDITEKIPNVSNIFNRLDSNQEVRYTDLFYWQLTPQAVEVLMRYCKMIHVLDYENTIECKKEEHIINEFISQGNKVELLEILQRSVV